MGRFSQEACEANATVSETNNICGLAILANQRSLIIVTNGTFVGWDDSAKCRIGKLGINL